MIADTVVVETTSTEASFNKVLPPITHTLDTVTFIFGGNIILASAPYRDEENQIKWSRFAISQVANVY